jgi:hypothetical protein
LSGEQESNYKKATVARRLQANFRRLHCRALAGCRISGMGASGDSKERLFYLNCEDASALIIPANSISRAPAAALLDQ